MCITNEDVFIKEWKMFFDNDPTVVNDVSEKRMRRLLDDFKCKVIDGNIIYVKVKEEVNVVKQEKFKYPSLALKVLNQQPEYNSLHLELLAKEICNKFGITFKQFYEKPMTGKSKAFIVEARVEFCLDAIEHFPINANRLSEFFEINHATISYYLHGKKLRTKKINTRKLA